MALNKIKVDYLEVFPSLVDFEYIYPNGGSALTPANVSINTRYEENSPFPGSPVLTQVELFFGGEWVTPGFFASSTTVSHGVSSYQQNDKIIVRTGITGLIIGSQVSGGSSTYTATTTMSTPTACRVKVWKVSPLPT